MKDFLVDGGRWNWAILFNKLPLELIDILELFLPPDTNVMKDQVYWGITKSVDFHCNPLTNS